jgi:cytochrome d ubiquinol oxidase subunit I
MATGSFDGQVDGLNQLQRQEERDFGRGNYMPNVRVIYWSMRVMAYMGVLMFLVAVVGAWLYWKQKLERARWFLWTAVVAIAFPYIAATAGWILTEMGRQPWIVQDLLKTADANSPAVSSPMVVFSLIVFVCLYLLLLVLDIWLMRRFAKVDPPELDRDETTGTPLPAIGY